MARVAFLGLGVMGYPMAGHLEAKGHDVTVYNRTAREQKNGSSNLAAAALQPRAKPRRARNLFLPVSETTTIYAL